VRAAVICVLALAASPAWAVEVSGRVAMRGSGDPAVASDVAVTGGLTVKTDGSGRFTVDLDPGQWTLTISGVDHLPLTAVLDVPLDGKLDLFVDPAPAPLEIVVESFKPTTHLSRHVVDAEQAYETPGTLDDGVRLVQSLPGVTIQREYSPSSGDLSVRGSAPGENRYYLDGVQIPYLYHFNQYSSVFPSSSLGSLQLFPSTFGAEYGNALGAIVEAETNTEAPEAVHGDVMVNFVLAGASIQAPVGKRWWLSASGRRSYQDLAGEATDQYTVWPIFGDYSLRAERELDDGGLGLFAWGASDRYGRAVGELDVLDPVEGSLTPSLDYRRGFQVAGVRRDWRGTNPSGRLVAAVVHDHLLGELSTGGAQEQRTVYGTSRLDLEGTASKHVTWEGGYELRAEYADLTADDVGDAALLVAREVPALARGIQIDEAGMRLRGAGYGGVHLLTGPVRWMPAVRFSGDSRAGEHVEPRAAVRVRAADQTELKAAGGWYSQSPPTADLMPFESVELPDATSWQVGGGVEQTVAGRLEFSVEGYRKWLVDPLRYPIDGPPVAVPSGDAYGVEIVTRYRLRGTFFLWGWLAFSRTTLTGEDGVRFAADGDQPFTGGIVASWDPSDALNLGLRYRYGSGLPYTPIDGSVYDAGQDAWAGLPGDPNSARLPAYQKVDAHFGYTWAFRRWSLTASAELWVVPKSSAALYPIWSYDYAEQGYVIGPTVLPLLGLRARY
jgi:hypothetical protein